MCLWVMNPVIQVGVKIARYRIFCKITEKFQKLHLDPISSLQNGSYETFEVLLLHRKVLKLKI